MSPALKRQRPEASLPLDARVFIASVSLPTRGEARIPSRVFFEQDDPEAHPHVPAWPGAATVAILLAASAASWLAVIALIRVLVS